MASLDYYELFGISRDADREQIELAYRVAAQQVHPDRVPRSLLPWAIQQTALLDEAFAVLSHPDSRAAYDDELGGVRAQRGDQAPPVTVEAPPVTEEATPATVEATPVIGAGPVARREPGATRAQEFDLADVLSGSELEEYRLGQAEGASGVDAPARAPIQVRPASVPASAVRRISGSAPAAGVPRRARQNRVNRPLVFAVGIVAVMILGALLYWRLNSGGSVQASTASSPYGFTPVPVDEQRVAFLKTAVQSNPKDYASLVELGNRYYDAAKWPEAEEWYTRALAVNSQDSNVLVDKAVALYYQGKITEAIAGYKDAIKVDPNKLQAYYNLAIAYASAQPPDFAAARKQLQTVIDLAPGTADAQEAKKQMDALPQ